MSPIGKKLYPFVILIAVAIGMFWGFRFRRNPSSPSIVQGEGSRQSTSVESVSKAPNPTSGAGQTTNAPNPLALPGPVSVPERKGPATPYLIGSADTPPQMEPMTLLGNVRHVINDYGSMFGGNPVGTNPEITAALNGDNPKGVKFLNEERGMRVNGLGELVDSWGTPFFFHQLSGTEMEIRSAGPDRRMYTADDLVMK